MNFYLPLKDLTTVGVDALVRGCPLLEELCLDWCQHVRGDDICKTVQQSPVCRSLKRFHLSGVPTSDEAVKAISSCTNLEYLHLGDTKATDLSSLAACTRINELHVCRGSMEVNKDTALRVLDLCPRINTWNCVRGTAVSQECGAREIRDVFDTGRN
eukprot:6192157-Ditylum_brightwellii.AAC.1